MTFSLTQCVEMYTLIAKKCGFHLPEGARMQCGFSSDNFQILCRSVGIQSKVILMEADRFEVMHMIATVGDMSFDWTYRQFDHDAAFPVIKTLSELFVDGWTEVLDDEEWNKIKHDRETWLDSLRCDYITHLFESSLERWLPVEGSNLSLMDQSHASCR